MSEIRKTSRPLFESGVQKWGKIDVVVNDAAMMTFKPIVELPDEDLDKVLNVNVRSVFLFCKYSVPHMPAGGAIVNISSVHAHETTRTWCHMLVERCDGRRSPADSPGTRAEEDADQLRCAWCRGYAHALEQPKHKERRRKGHRRDRQARRYRGCRLLPCFARRPDLSRVQLW